MHILKQIIRDLTECCDVVAVHNVTNSLPGGHSVLVPPDPISNSEVKRLCADDSVGSPHAKVGHCQASNQNPGSAMSRGFFFVLWKKLNTYPGILQGME